MLTTHEFCRGRSAMMLSHSVCWLGGFCCQKRCSTWVTINHVNPWCSKICLASTGHLAQSSISSMVWLSPKSYCKTAEVLDTWAEFKQLKRHSSHCLSMLSPCPGPSAILKNSLSAWLVTWSNSNSSNGTLPTVCLCCLLSCFLPRALCNIEEFSLSLTGHLAEIKQFKTALFLPANCSGCLQYWRNLANNTKNLGILVSFWNFSISRPIN